MFIVKENKIKKLSIEKGSTLLEVLIAVLVISIGMLGVAALQATSLRNNQSASERTSAVILTYSIIDRMRANRAAALGGSYNINTVNDFAACAAPNVSGLAGSDLNQWWLEMRGSTNPPILPMLSSNACAAINCSSLGMCTVQIWWDDSLGTAAVQNPESFSVITRVQL